MNPKERIDIHDYEGRYNYVVSSLKNGVYNAKTGKTEKISDRDIELILKFDNICKKENISLARRERVIAILHILARHFFERDFDKIKKADMDKIQDSLLDSDYSLWTKATYFSIIKKFYKWLEYGDNYKEKEGYPDIVRSIKTNIKEREKPKIKPSDILTEEEVQRMIDNAENIRDKAFISMIYELGCRISEIGNLKIKDCVREEVGYTINLKGKTGERTPILIISDRYLTEWLEQHTLKKPESPLWVMLGKRNKNERVSYDALRMLIKRLAEKSGIKRRIYPHIFRHSRVSHLLMNGDITETQAKVFFGWTPDSKQLNTYSHITSKQVNDKIKEKYGLLKKEESIIKEKVCYRCQLVNSKNSFFCARCGLPLDSKTAFKLKEKENEASSKIKKYLEDTGFLDRIAKEMSKEVNKGVSE